jgi:hypothetical protein
VIQFRSDRGNVGIRQTGGGEGEVGGEIKEKKETSAVRNACLNPEARWKVDYHKRGKGRAIFI